jgi:hypothetical protein
MSRFRRIIPVVGVALGVVLVPPLVSVATSPPETTEPSFSPMPSSASESSAPASSDPVDGASGARRQWLEFTEEADPASYAWGASLRDLVAGERVLMIGDSVMASTSSRYGGEMCQELVPRGWHVEMDAESGRFVDFGDRVLDSRLDAEWDAAVVMLGNNYGADKTVFADYLEDIVDRLAPRPTVLLTVTEFRPDRADVNDTIYEIAAEYDNVRVVDWAAETAADPALVGGDGLHLSDLGRARYADLVGGALGRAPGVGEGDCLGSDFTDDSAVLPEPGQVTPPPNQFPNNNNNGGGGGGGATTQPAPPPTTVAATPTTVAVTPTTVVVPVEPPPEEPPPDEPPPDEPPPDEPPPDEPPPDEPPPSQGS